MAIPGSAPPPVRGAEDDMPMHPPPAALAALLLLAAAAAAPLRHEVTIPYRDFGVVTVESDYAEGADYDLRPEGCYARSSPEAVCGFTLRARTPIVVTNLANPSHAVRADGQIARTCCMFAAGDPQGYPLVAPGAPAEGVRPLERRLSQGETLQVLMRIPDYRNGAAVTGVTFSRGAGDPGRGVPVTVRDLASPAPRPKS